MDIRPNGHVPTRRAPAEWFTGDVWLSPIIEAAEPARLQAASVTFTPGSRTNWHTHPLGQTLYVTAGAGLAQTLGGPVRRIAAGDVVWIPPGEKHWHGASPTTGMTHIAMQERRDGQAVEWLEPVADADYSGEPR